MSNYDFENKRFGNGDLSDKIKVNTHFRGGKSQYGGYDSLQFTDYSTDFFKPEEDEALILGYKQPVVKGNKSPNVDKYVNQIFEEEEKKRIQKEEKSIINKVKKSSMYTDMLAHSQDYEEKLVSRKVAFWYNPVSLVGISFVLLLVMVLAVFGMIGIF